MKTRFVSTSLLALLVILTLVFSYFTWSSHHNPRVVVEWSTASELDTVGFNVYRGESATDPGIIVNADLIPASTDEHTGGEYKYIDEDIVPGRVYYYFLEDVNESGATNRHGPIEVSAQPNDELVWLWLGVLVVVLLGILSIIIWMRRNTSKRGNG